MHYIDTNINKVNLCEIVQSWRLKFARISPHTTDVDLNQMLGVGETIRVKLNKTIPNIAYNWLQVNTNQPFCWEKAVRIGLVGYISAIHLVTSIVAQVFAFAV